MRAGQLSPSAACRARRSPTRRRRLRGLPGSCRRLAGLLPAVLAGLRCAVARCAGSPRLPPGWTGPFLACDCPSGRAPTIPPERSRGVRQSLKSAPRTRSSSSRSASNRGMSSWRCCQPSGCRSRLSRCRNCSIRAVRPAAAEPGRNRPTAEPTRRVWATARCASVASGCAVTFCRGISATSPLLHPQEIEDAVERGGGLIHQLPVPDDENLLTREHREDALKLLAVPPEPGVVPERGPARRDAALLLLARLDDSRRLAQARPTRDASSSNGRARPDPG